MTSSITITYGIISVTIIWPGYMTFLYSLMLYMESKNTKDKNKNSLKVKILFYINKLIVRSIRS